MNDYKPQKYLLEIRNDKQAAVEKIDDALAQFLPYRFQIIPLYRAVTVRSPEAEQSLLEVLAKLPEVSYRKAKERHALEDNNDRSK